MYTGVNFNEFEIISPGWAEGHYICGSYGHWVNTETLYLHPDGKWYASTARPDDPLNISLGAFKSAAEASDFLSKWQALPDEERNTSFSEAHTKY